MQTSQLYIIRDFSDFLSPIIHWPSSNGSHCTYNNTLFYYWQLMHFRQVRSLLPSKLKAHKSQPLVKTCIANCGQMVPDTTVVCIDRLYGTYHHRTQQYHHRAPRGTPFPKMGNQHSHAEQQPHCRVSLPFVVNVVPKKLLVSGVCWLIMLQGQPSNCTFQLSSNHSISPCVATLCECQMKQTPRRS